MSALRSTHALEICRELGDRHGEGSALGNLGIALREVRRFDEARRVWKQAAQAFENSGDLESAEALRGWVAALVVRGKVRDCVSVTKVRETP
jgi:hypothetical protein